MWRRCRNWYRNWERSELDMLANPAPECAAPGLTGSRARRLAQMSPIERRQLGDFVRTYQGARILGPLFWLSLAFTAIGMLMRQWLHADLGWGSTVFAANAVGFTCAMVWLRAWFNYRRDGDGTTRTVAVIVGQAMLGALVGMSSSVVMHGRGFAGELHQLSQVLGTVGLGALVLVGGPLLLIGAFRKRQHDALAAELRRDAEQERLARALSETQLRLLRAQIEPHFLFNTLGAVQQLAEQDAPRAAELTANLIAFLRASLGEMRSDSVGLAEEFGLIDAYLRVMQVRLGQRLRFTLALEPGLEQLALPSMMLLTLVENAIKHGIEPSLRGGEVRVSAALAGDMVHLAVHDTGVGLGAAPVDGTGLTNARRRLELAHHGAASLTLRDADPGTVAEIRLPMPGPA